MNCSISSSFEASNLVNGFHAVPHVDIDLNQSPSDFQINLDYFEAVVIWACIPILIVVCLFVLMSVYFICVCCCCCFQQHEKRSTCSKATCGVLVTLLIALCIAMVGVGLWAEFEWDRNLNQFVSTASDTNNLVGDIQMQAASYEFNSLTGNLSFVDSQLPTNDPARQAVGILMDTNQELELVFNDISTKASLASLTPVLNVASTVELARHWTVVAYLIVLALFLLLLAVSLCCSACCSSPVCTVLTLFIFSFMTFTAWAAVGGNLAYLVVAGDICYDPDNLIRNYTSNAPNATIPSSVVDYYLVCNESCVPSPFQTPYDNATVAFQQIQTIEEGLRESIRNTTPSLLPTVDDIFVLFNNAESAITNLTMLSDCSRVNSDYLSVLNSFCTDGYLYSLILFAMICGLAVGMLVSVICASFFAGLLSAGKEYDEETVVYDFPEGQNSPWDSYGAGQNIARGQYSQFQEQYHLRSSPPNDDPGPPKYTELSTRTTSMDNGGDAERRPVSGAYDHFTDS